jgi:hypothetical protein
MTKKVRHVPFIDAHGNHLAIARATHGGMHPPVPIPPAPNGHPVKIKLPRRILHACMQGRLSDAFSHQDDLEGRLAIIWCTNDAREPTHAFRGIVEKISSKGLRRWAVRVAEAVDPAAVLHAA